jgi:hypothetical protein
MAPLAVCAAVINVATGTASASASSITRLIRVFMFILFFEPRFPAPPSRQTTIVADEDRVVVVPQEHGAEVLQQAQAIDDRERWMFPFIRQLKSLQQAIAKFNRT